jgi:anti-sigma B factor antagonist
MNIQILKQTLSITGLSELSAANAVAFRDQTRAALTDQIKTLDVDMSLTRFVDSSGLGALISVHKTLVSRGGTVRILNPTPTAQQILELTRLHRVFEIVKA